MPRPLASAAVVAVAFALGGCDAAASRTAPTVAVSVPPQAYFVERLLGDASRIEVMVPPGTSPATHEPSLQQVRAMSRAAVYVKVGHPKFPFERAWLDRLLAEGDDVRVVDCAEGLELRGRDPHIWLSPSAVGTMVPRIADALAHAYPAQAEAIAARKQRLMRDIEALDADLRRLLDDLPRRRFYVFHPAWGYFARDYGLEQVAIEQGKKEPDPHTLARLIARARKRRVRTIFVQPQFSRRSAALVASEIGADVEVLDPLARDWEHNLRHTAAVLREALSGE